MARTGVCSFLQPLGHHEDCESHHWIIACVVPATSQREVSLTSLPAVNSRASVVPRYWQKRFNMLQESLPFGPSLHF